MSAPTQLRGPLGILVMALLVAVFPACDNSSPTPDIDIDNLFAHPNGIPLEWVEVDVVVRVVEPMTDVFKSQPAWAHFYEQYAAFEGPTPEYDFDEVTMVVVAWGPVAGCPDLFGGSIQSVTVDDEKAYVLVGPLADFGPCEAGTLLTQIIQFPRVDVPVRFRGAVPG